ncbi:MULTISPECIES: gamma-glutamylcyclotransferase family protein [Streptomyces]|uniref:Gamma-glutamylcyclotransferase n=1 Tax=Streptomyces griseiscabiei TaxID=2993540 RepID=A0ABU4L101_9ACTN|nr:MULTISPECIES: gamma-glutamylcyclotransferase family protein [Streptomyces]MBZ3900589.1 gamma-glutamylcyclotransferase [Streptomyces griseiscabiei]MDX2909288.1 gamma-glutamylcyclotransferase [Streptomyces griseiscabiei]
MLPFFVYGTLRPGEVNHDLFLRGRTRTEEPARMYGMTLYDGPGYPYAVETGGAADGAAARAGVSGELVTARPESYAELLRTLDELEEYAPDDPANLYERVAREAILADGTAVRAWVYVAAPHVAAGLRAGGKPIDGGDWRTHRPRG